MRFLKETINEMLACGVHSSAVLEVHVPLSLREESESRASRPVSLLRWSHRVQGAKQKLNVQVGWLLSLS